MDTELTFIFQSLDAQVTFELSVGRSSYLCETPQTSAKQSSSLEQPLAQVF